jgi:hypothetical protein
MNLHKLPLWLMIPDSVGRSRGSEHRLLVFQQEEMPWKARVTSRFCSSQGLVQSFATRAKVASCTEKCSVSRSKKLGIPFKEESDSYLQTEMLQGAKIFALWPLSQAAQSCFGKDSWPDDIPAPQAWLEFDVDSVDKATAELESRRHRMLVKNKKEPWGQIVSRFISPEGLLVGITFTPSMRGQK